MEWRRRDLQLHIHSCAGLQGISQDVLDMVEERIKAAGCRGLGEGCKASTPRRTCRNYQVATSPSLQKSMATATHVKGGGSRESGGERGNVNIQGTSLRDRWM